MNTASEAIIRWLLSRNSNEPQEVDRFVEALKQGMLDNDPASHSILEGALIKAKEEAGSGPDAKRIEQLIALHYKLKGLDEAEKTVEVLQEIRTVADLPPISGTLARVRSWGILSHLKRLGGGAD